MVFLDRLHFHGDDDCDRWFRCKVDTSTMFISNSTITFFICSLTLCTSFCQVISFLFRHSHHHHATCSSTLLYTHIHTYISHTHHSHHVKLYHCIDMAVYEIKIQLCTVILLEWVSGVFKRMQMTKSA